MSALARGARYFSVLAGSLLVIALGLRACLPDLPEAGSFRYRLTIDVETPEGVKSGSSVIQITETPQIKTGSGSGSAMSVSGEAVTVDLGSRGKLFVLLKNASQNMKFSSAAGAIVYSTFPTGRGGEALPENIKRYRDEKLVASLTPDQLPVMVRFRDPNDVTTMEGVDPHHLEASFGFGVRLAHARLETSRDPVTRLIDPHLPSFGRGSGFAEWRRGIPYGDPRYVDLSEFKRSAPHGS